MRPRHHTQSTRALWKPNLQGLARSLLSERHTTAFARQSAATPAAQRRPPQPSLQPPRSPPAAQHSTKFQQLGAPVIIAASEGWHSSVKAMSPVHGRTL